MYYNPNTQEQKSLFDLKKLLNASIPNNVEQVNDAWFLLHQGSYPEYDAATQKVVSDGVKLIDGKYTTAYKVEALTAEEQAQQAEILAQQAADEAARQLEEAKQVRADAVAKITVEVDGMIFDGDEKAQDSMSRVASIAGVDEQNTTLPWVLADNTVANVTVAQIKEALRKALYAQAALWVVPYTGSAA